MDMNGHDRNKLQYRHDVDNTSVRVHAMWRDVSWDEAKVAAADRLRERIRDVEALTEDQFKQSKREHFEGRMGELVNFAAFMVDGYMVCGTTFDAAKKEVVEGLQREIGFVGQLTPELYEISKKRNFR